MYPLAILIYFNITEMVYNDSKPNQKLETVMKPSTICSAILLLIISSNSYSECVQSSESIHKRHALFEKLVKAVRVELREECSWTLEEVDDWGACKFQKRKIKLLGYIDQDIKQAYWTSEGYVAILKTLDLTCHNITEDKRQESIEDFEKYRNSINQLLKKDSETCKGWITKHIGGACDTQTNK